MESLQDAIEKARLEREGQIGQTAAPGESTTPEQEPGHGTLDNKTSRPDSGTTDGQSKSGDQEEHFLPSLIRYTSTRQIEPDEKTLRQNRVIAGDAHDPRVEIYRQLRSQVLSNMKSHNWQTLAITSAHENAGKTLTAINLAISISQEVSQTVMLVDLDLRTPHVHTTLGIDIDKGIVDHLQHEEPLENILFNPGFPRLVVLPGKPQGRHSSEILSSPRMQEFMDDITGRYPDRIVIFDLPPLLRNDDAMVFVPKVDTCLLIIEEGVTRPDDIERSLQLFNPSQLIGTILNKAR